MGDPRMGAIKQYELSVSQFGIYVCTIYLGAIQFIGENDNLILGGTAQSIPVRIVGELEIHAVGITRKTDLRFGVQRGVIGYDDVIPSFFVDIGSGLQISKGNRKATTAILADILRI